MEKLLEFNIECCKQLRSITRFHLPFLPSKNFYLSSKKIVAPGSHGSREHPRFSFFRL